jgi:hypothetical protein
VVLITKWVGEVEHLNPAVSADQFLVGRGMPNPISAWRSIHIVLCIAHFVVTVFFEDMYQPIWEFPQPCVCLASRCISPKSAPMHTE